MAKKKSATPKKLETYRKKRDFAVTGEPPPGPGKPAQGRALTFMVHKHDATRLHYDLRLEIEGVLASWAIPKGPSYDPGAKRLAVQTEDHPYAYGSFEGRIPDGEYGAGDSIIWDRGTWDTDPPGQAVAQRKKGHLVIDLHGEKLEGKWHLVRTRPFGGKDQWLCFKAKDGKEKPDYDVVAARPESVHSGRRVTRGPVRKTQLRAAHLPPESLLEKVWPPMKATLSSLHEVSASEVLLEVKYDGYRGLAALSGGKLAFHTRNQLDLTDRFPTLSRALSRVVVGEAVIDGEVVALDAKGASRFEKLQDPDAEHRFIAFDLLWLEGEDLRTRPLEERRELLESLLSHAPLPLQLSERVGGTFEEALESMRRRGMEGVIAKRKGSPYAAGRSRDWLKLKVTGTQELAILGYTPISNGKKELGALLVGVRDGEDYRFAGKVGTGFSAPLRKELRAKLDEDRVELSKAIDAPRLRDAIWVKPKLVAQVAFTEWTRDGKLRHPSFQGLRADKSPEECVRETSAPVQAPREGKTPATGAKKTRRPPLEKVELSSGSKVLYPKSKVTKADVFAYYHAVADVMVPALEGRPLALQQWPKGIGQPGFFRQDVPQAPAWATTLEVLHEGNKKVEHIVVDRPETLLWLANQNALTLHTWASRAEHLTEPDWALFDLDPGEGSWEELIQIAVTLRGLLEELGLASFPKTSGKRGLHVLVPMARGHTFDDALGFAVAITRVLEKGLPQLATTERTIKLRRGKLYLDAFQNGRGKTVVAPYSLRAVEGATVSTPLAWSEVTPKLDPTTFTYKTVPARLEKKGDLFAPVLQSGQRLPRFDPP